MNIASAATMAAGDGETFSHPGIISSSESLARMKQYIADGTEPVMSSYRTLVADKRAQVDYKMAGPFRTIARDGDYTNTKGPSESDFSAAYYNALMYHLTGDEAHHDKSLEIINAYSDTLYNIEGHDAPLCCLHGYYLVNAMELMRNHASVETQQRWAGMIRRAFIPVMDRFELMSPYANGNWGTLSLVLRTWPRYVR